MTSSGKQALVGRRERTSLKAPDGEARKTCDPLFSVNDILQGYILQAAAVIFIPGLWFNSLYS